MTKAELVDEIAQKADLTRKHSEVIVDAVFSSIIDARVAALRRSSPTAIRPWFWRIAPRLRSRASPTDSASSTEPGMAQGTVTVSARATASVLIGWKLWLQMPKAVAMGECV